MNAELPPLSPTRLLSLLEAAAARRPVLVWGPSGSGKSALLLEHLRSRGLPAARCELGELARPAGPGPLDELVSGAARQAPRLTARAQPVALLLGGLEAATPEQAGDLVALLEGARLGRYALPPGSLVLAEGRLEGASPPALPPALRGRFLQLRLAPCARDWLRWAAGRELAREVCEHLEAHPGHLCSSPGGAGPASSPRAWHALAELWEAGLADPEPFARGLLGTAHAEAFLARRARPRARRRQVG